MADLDDLIERAQEWMELADAHPGTQVFSDAWAHYGIVRDLALLASSAPATASEGVTEARCGCTIGGLHRYACGLVGHVDPPRPTGVTSSDGDRRLSDEELDALLHWLHGGAAGGIQSLWAMVERILAARTAQPEGVERVEWGHRYPDGSLIPDSSEEVAKSRAAISRARGGEPLVLVRRTVTPWEVVGDE